MKLYFENKSTRVKRALYGDATGKIKTFAILTAENPGAKEYSAEENNKRTERLKTLFKHAGIQYIQIQGFYERKEHSFICFNLTLNEAKRFCYLNYDAPIDEWQESFFFGEVSPDGTEISYYKLSDREYKLVEKSKRIDNAKDFDNYFSRYHDFKFSIWMKVFNEDLLLIYSEEDLDKALQDGGNGIDRIYHRKRAYRSNN